MSTSDLIQPRHLTQLVLGRERMATGEAVGRLVNNQHELGHGWQTPLGWKIRIHPLKGNRKR